MTAVREWAAIPARVPRLRDVSAFVIERPDRRRDDAPLIGTPYGLDITDDLADQLRTRTKERILAVRESRVIAYDPGHRPDSSEVIGMRLDEVEGLEELREEILSNAAPPYNTQAERPRRLALTGATLGVGEAAIVCLQRFAPRQVLSSSKLLYFLNKGNVYDALQDDDGFAFDLDFDLFVSGDYLFAMDKQALERAVGFDQQVQEAARANAEKLTRRLRFANEDDFVRACTRDLRFARKVANIVARRSFARVTLRDVQDHARRSNVDLAVNAQNELVFSNAIEERWILLKLLDDDFLMSEMTNERYEVNSKVMR